MTKQEVKAVVARHWQHVSQVNLDSNLLSIQLDTRYRATMAEVRSKAIQRIFNDIEEAIGSEHMDTDIDMAGGYFFLANDNLIINKEA